MTNDRIIGLILMAFGVLALLSWLGGSSLIWLGALAAFFLYLYVQQRNYGFLLAGGALGGLTLGLVLGGSLGAILLSLALAAFIIDRLEPKPSRWALYAAATLAALGFVIAIGQTGVLSSLWFALLLVAVGIFLLLRKEPRGWTYSRASPPPVPSAGTASPGASVTPAAPAASPAAAEASPESEVRKNALQAQDEAKPVREQEQPEQEGTEQQNTGQENTQQEAPEEAKPALQPEAQALYRHLEMWRRQQAAEEAKPAYIILTNESLLQIARERPATLDELKMTKGIGPVKLERYGEAILRVVQESR